ncbi:hypothetical protein GPECTOR_17g924 [Gonium pectorale]|uniref:C2 domain-containing protein n=1 Tax=Gonium pectorale TaxID=33097 RepID=A0A150GKN3_GONPE|nr:hypothetical protein GPECTOR_17g924 [Gonium pectorale]|eukprot:KXZ50285.1 hypothetical protein GPECTOR_17g924 [Gonium pectorale]
MHGYGSPQLVDLELNIKGAQALPRMDFVGHCDPYVVVKIMSPDGHQKLFQYKTSVIYNTANPVFDEEVNLRNVPLGALLFFEVYDKDHLTADDIVGTCELRLEAASAGGIGVQLPIRPARNVPARAGSLDLGLRHRPSVAAPGPVLHCGPVRYRVSVSSLAGAVTGHTDESGWLAYAAYKLSLAGLPLFFPEGAAVHWNVQYDKAQQAGIFTNPVMIKAIRTQHSVLYADGGDKKSRGVLRGGGDLVALLRGGVRGGQRRYYTYAICADGSLCFSETGAAFFADFMSKHAMHAGCAENVVYAGEFCLVPPGLPLPQLPDGLAPADTAGGTAASAADAALAEAAAAGVPALAHIANSAVAAPSGTYAPPAAKLPALAALLGFNLRGLRVEVLESRDPRLAELHRRIPSRVRA